MKVGMIFECGPDGADVQVCGALAERLVPGVQVAAVTLDSKPRLVRDCGKAATALLKQGCRKVLIIWDLFPPWRTKGAKPCRREDREAIFASLRSAGVAMKRVALICIQEELEAWLITDGRALSTVISTPHRPVKIRHQKRAEHVSNPKSALERFFVQNGRPKYVDRKDAIRIVRALPDLRRLERLPTFARFSEKLVGR